ncbi:small acid-soluble spore protein I (minor) [Paenibacillus forsythiae]|uniref:Small, acid-soluble spore protein I n=1 Tax=Paenibacillus forsythiae TaxID=365616 RepID=A0ABU3HAU1_9BACL|nr:small acid-soluble spore protein SspI [Paenibacillus forsythiae]MDT3427947.1 small acid-soluble spore protein I (minor) [Paenibacillus forsythiae]
MSITLDLRQAVIHKVHGHSKAELREMIDGSVDGPETALPGLGAVFEMIWKDLDPAKKENIVSMLYEHLKSVTPGSLTGGN